MKNTQLGKIVIFITLTFGLVFELYSQTQGNGQQNTNNQNTTGTSNTTGSTKTTTTLVDYLINDFENAEDWYARSTNPIGETKTKKVIQVGPIYDVYNPNDLTDDEKASFKEGVNHVLGVKTYFLDQGFDRVEVKPPHEYIIQGVARQLSVWVLGRQFRHTLYAKLRDYRGKIHKIRIGRLDFFGWRKMSVTIPGWLPQSTRYALLDKNLHFVSLFTECDKKEVPGVFYFYVDNLRMKVDKTDTEYPGSQIKDTW